MKYLRIAFKSTNKYFLRLHRENALFFIKSIHNISNILLIDLLYIFLVISLLCSYENINKIFYIFKKLSTKDLISSFLKFSFLFLKFELESFRDVLQNLFEF